MIAATTMSADAIEHAEDVIDAQPGIDFDSLMDHVESNFPDLSSDEESEVRHILRDRHYPTASTIWYSREYRGGRYVLVPMGNGDAAMLQHARYYLEECRRKGGQVSEETFSDIDWSL